jgi:hypothetical protein
MEVPSIFPEKFYKFLVYFYESSSWVFISLKLNTVVSHLIPLIISWVIIVCVSFAFLFSLQPRMTTMLSPILYAFLQYYLLFLYQEKYFHTLLNE